MRLKIYDVVDAIRAHLDAVIATKILGARKGRFYDEMGNVIVKPKKIKGHSVSLQVRKNVPPTTSLLSFQQFNLFHCCVLIPKM